MILLCIILFLIFLPYLYQSLQYQSNGRVYFEERISNEVSRVFTSKIHMMENQEIYFDEYNEYPTSVFARFILNHEFERIIFSEFSLKDDDFTNFDLDNYDNYHKLNPVPKKIVYISEKNKRALFFERVKSLGKKEDVWFKLYEFDALNTLFPPQNEYTELTLQNLLSAHLIKDDLTYDFSNISGIKLNLKSNEELGYIIEYITFFYRLEILEKSRTLQGLGLLEINARPQWIKNAYLGGFLEDMNMLFYFRNKNMPVYLQVDDEKMPGSISLESLPTDKLLFFNEDGVEYFVMLVDYSDYLGPGIYKVIWGKKSLLINHSVSVITEKEYHQILLSVIILLVIGAVIRFLLVRRLHSQLNTILQDQDYKNISVVPTREKIFNTFVLLSNRSKSISQHLPDQISGYLIDHKNDYPVDKVQIGCLVIDLKGFTLYSENRSNFNLTRMLNIFYSICIQVVRSQNGRIDKFMGDGIVALWNCNDVSEVSTKMVVSASNISQLCAQNEIFQNTGMSIRIGIDINNGYMGIFGSELRLCYTASGESIAFANKLESMNNIYKSEVLLSERVVKTCDQSDKDYIIRWVDRIKFKSNHEKIYELVPLHSPVYTLVNDNVYIKRYEMALNKYCLEEYSVAYKLFCEIQSAYPDDYLAHIFIMRCKKFLD